MINTKKIMSLCLAGGLVLSSMPKVYAHAENPLNIETNISVPLTKHVRYTLLRYQLRYINLL